MTVSLCTTPTDRRSPGVVFAGMSGHAQDAALLEFTDEAIQEVPKVSF